MTIMQQLFKFLSLNVAGLTSNMKRQRLRIFLQVERLTCVSTRDSFERRGREMVAEIV